MPSLRIVSRRSPVCSGSTVRSRVRFGDPAGMPPKWRSTRRSASSVSTSPTTTSVALFGNVVAAVVAVEIVAGHRLQIGEPADGRMAVGVRLERRRGQLLIEQLVGIVLAALQLGDDDRALRLAVVGMVEAAAPSARTR